MTSVLPFTVDPSDPAQSFAFRAAMNDPRFLERTVAVRLDDSAIDGRSMFGLVQTDTFAGALNFYAANSGNCAPMTSSVFPVDVLRAVPFIISNGFGIQAVGFGVSTVGGAGSVARMGIYDSTADLDGNLYPNRLIFDAGEKDTTATGWKTTTTAQLLDEGRVYWMAYHCGVAAPTVVSIPPVGSDALLGLRVTAVPPIRLTHITVARAYAALPFTFPSGASAVAAGPPCLVYAFTRPSSTRKVRYVPLYAPATTGTMLRRVRLSKGDSLRVTDPGRPYVILTALTRGASGTRTLGVFDSRKSALTSGVDYRMNGEDVEFQMSTDDEAVMQIEQFGYPKVSLRDTTAFVDVQFNGGS